jgi:8-oxo-dGTP pyrophosphatase MutT (NUDIX family)
VQFTREHLRSRLNLSPGSQISGDDSAERSGGLPAAVLIGLVDRSGGPTVLLTKRTEHLKDHAGQICFPGGRIEPEDDTVEAAALREAEEEIGLAPEKVDVIQRLAPYDTSTGFRIHPVVGWIEPPFKITPDDFEVAEVFELPLSFVLDPANHQRQSHVRNNQRRSYYVLPYEGRFIWGATAGMLVNFSKLLTP